MTHPLFSQMLLRYLFLYLIAILLLPVIYYQGRRIKSTMPDLPEAADPEGEIEQANGKVFNLLTIGESTMAGVGVDNHKEGFTGKIAELINDQYGFGVKWQVIAKSGITAAGTTELIVPKLGVEADMIIIGLGGNDAFNFHSPKKWKEDIMGLINALRLKYPSAPLVFTNMPPIKEFPAFTTSLKLTMGNLIELYGEQLEEIAHEIPNVFFSNQLVRIKDWNEQNGQNLPYSSFFSDGVHPSKLTYQELAKVVAKFIYANKILRS